MTEDCFKFLNPAQELSDDEVGALFRCVQEQFPVDWEVVSFMLQKHQPDMALEWLRRKQDKKLLLLADVLERMFEMKQERQHQPRTNLTINRADSFKQEYGSSNQSAIINM